MDFTIFVDDGSEDNTKEICGSYAKCLWISKARTSGGGDAIRLGLETARRLNVPQVITMDADWQHSPEDLKPFLDFQRENECDVIVGSRRLGSVDSYSGFRQLGVWFFGLFISGLGGKRISDPSSGFRLLDVEKWSALDLRERQFHTAELLIEAIRSGYKINELPIHISRRRCGQSKKGNDIFYALSFLRVCLSVWFR